MPQEPTGEDLARFQHTAEQIVLEMDEPEFHVSTGKQLLTVAKISTALRAAYLKGIEHGASNWDPEFGE